MTDVEPTRLGHGIARRRCPAAHARSPVEAQFVEPPDDRRIRRCADGSRDRRIAAGHPHPRRGRRLLRRRRLGGHQQRRQRPRTGDLVRRIPHTANRVSNWCTASTCPWCAACGAWRSAWAAIWPWPPISRWPPTTPCSGSRSSRGASAPTRAPRGCSPGWSAWLGPRRCCCSARR